jgi:hypothetical protein
MLQHYEQDADSHQLPAMPAEYSKVNLHCRAFPINSSASLS